MSDENSKGIAEVKPEQTYEFWVEARNGKKQNYMFSPHKATTCTHRTLLSVQDGSPFYRCPDCNYVMNIVAANIMPLHHLVAISLGTLQHTVKEFGVASMQEMVHRPLGQWDNTPQKSLVGEGQSIADSLRMLEGVDVNTPDHGKAQLRALQAEHLVSPKEKRKFGARLQRQALQEAERAREALEKRKVHDGRELPSGGVERDTNSVSTLPQRELIEGHSEGHQRES